MKVLDMPAYDAILGYDWLQQNSPMTCDWAAKTLQFQSKAKSLLLQGVQSSAATIQEMSIQQMRKWATGNDIWAIAVVEAIPEPPPIAHQTAVQQVLRQYQDVFQDPQQLPPSRFYDHHIPLLPGAAPVNARPYMYPPHHKDEIEKQVQQLLTAGLITRSCSPFASPVLLVLKKDGSWRFCVDYRKLNAITVRNRFPMPIIDEILDELAGTKYFTKLDMRSGYHQVRMKPEDEYKMAFKTHQGHYQFNVMPFGLTNAPATFQCIMNEVLAPFLMKFVMVFLDDILIYSPDFDTHLHHLQLVLEKLSEHKLYMKASKCSFAQTQLEYLGHIISDAGVATNLVKIEAMIKWPVPTTVTELRGFLGLTGYYRKFVHHYGLIAYPLTQLLRKKQFQWTTTPVLALPNFAEQFIIETDASDIGIGAVLMQHG